MGQSVIVVTTTSKVLANPGPPGSRLRQGFGRQAIPSAPSFMISYCLLLFSAIADFSCSFVAGLSPPRV